MASQYQMLYKMIVLYMLSRSEVLLTKSQIYDFMLDKRYTTFITMQEVFGELSDQGMIKEQKDRNRTFLKITNVGNDTLELFLPQMNPAIVHQIDDYLRSNRIRLRNESAVRADYVRKPNGDYQVYLSVVENGDVILRLSIDVPSEQAAQHICDKWAQNSQDVYQYLIKRLIMDDTTS